MIEIKPIEKPIDATVKVPGSKSYTNRALLIASLANGKSHLSGALFSDDTDHMVDSLRKLGVSILADPENCTFEVVGNGSDIPVNQADLYVGNAGTAARPLVSYVALGNGRFRIDGDPPMRDSRPIGDLLDALRQLGVEIRSELNNDRFPLIVEAKKLRGGKTRLNANKSSQFLTSLLMIAPVTQLGMEIELEGNLISKPYIDITISVMRAFGADVVNENYYSFKVYGNQIYTPRNYQIEPDASNASYFFALAAVTGGRVRLENLNLDSGQGDIRFVNVLQEMGCQVFSKDSAIEVVGTERLTGIDVDMNEISDTSLTLAAIAPFAEGKTTIRNIEHIRWQETDRIHAVVTELRKLGVSVTEYDDAIEIEPVSEIQPAEIDTYHDHRIAMSFSLIGTKKPGIKIKNPGCVNKTFPTFFDVLAGLNQ